VGNRTEIINSELINLKGLVVLGAKRKIKSQSGSSGTHNISGPPASRKNRADKLILPIIDLWKHWSRLPKIKKKKPQISILYWCVLKMVQMSHIFK
jgi:hypothetical protein